MLVSNIDVFSKLKKILGLSNNKFWRQRAKLMPWACFELNGDNNHSDNIPIRKKQKLLSLVVLGNLCRINPYCIFMGTNDDNSSHRWHIQLLEST